ncbi:MAG: hypothetical protein HOP33_17905 [Verrucomicrobia bacterium]|nr:hypothetical protein [Verrucomicrobiota bacterium]
MEDRESKFTDALLAVVAVALIIISLLVYLKWDSDLVTKLGPCWKDFVLPVITNLVAALAAIAISFFTIQRIHAARSASQREAAEQRIRSIVREVCEPFAKALETRTQTFVQKIDRVESILAEQFSKKSTELLREAVTNALAVQNPKAPVPSVLKDAEQLAGGESVDVSSQSAPSRRKSNKKGKQ